MTESLPDENTLDIFSNPQQVVEDLPRADTLDFSALEPNFLKAATVLWGLFVLVVWIAPILFLAGVININGYGFTIASWVIILGMIPVALLNIFEIKARGYAMRDHDIVYKKGLVWRTQTIVPFNRVQHVETHRGPVDRLAGLSDLKIYTAGGISADCSISGLSVAGASALRQAILKRIEGAEKSDPDAGLAEQQNDD